ncbi:MAG: hypothetical protein IJ352_09730 [Muribaculaceae bacterium]|nr:hypothetical protein [Muribaculaceae bacterium]MBQ3606143.1 hypothetical protein [Muribaculaceae bacterium]MBQ7855276.1 hypothetical protein [Muribaculaceae bacterium]MBR3829927.1 hypothetical protein [Muribaculaceae bacterium]
MAKYESKPVAVNQPIEALFDRFSDISLFQQKIEEIPAEERAKIGDVTFEADAICINTPQVGQLKFQVTERTAPGHIVFSAVGSPIPLSMVIDIKSISESASEVVTAIDVEIPAMLRPLIGGKMQEAADKFGEMIGKLNG